MLKCPRCPRTELNLDSLNQEVSLNNFKSGFPIDFLTQVEKFLFCGDIGDPIYATEFLEIVEYIRTNSNVQLHIVTNGSYKKPDWWKQLGQLLDHNDMVTFSVDGWDNISNNQYRVNSNFDSILAGISSLRSSSNCSIVWSMIYFLFNQDKVNDMKKLAASLGCNRFQTVKSSKFGERYQQENVDLLKPNSKFVAAGSMYETAIEVLNQDQHQNTPQLTPLQLHAWAKCLRWEKELFINVDGYVFPCPWFNSGYLKNDFFEQHKNQLNIKTRALKEILEDTLWNDLYTKFESNPLEICQLKCKGSHV
jgi:MoaA/NifB/PqqE/SkfB family radical SAM enzyme